MNLLQFLKSYELLGKQLLNLPNLFCNVSWKFIKWPYISSLISDLHLRHNTCRTQSHSLSHTVSLTVAHSLTHCRTQSHSLSHTVSLTVAHSLTHCRTQSHSLSHTVSLTVAHSLTVYHFCYIFLFFNAHLHLDRVVESPPNPNNTRQLALMPC